MEQTRAYRAIFFDLDGTLLPMDLDTFIKDYFARIGAYAVANGFDPETFQKGFGGGTKQMMALDGVLNETAFWEAFSALTGVPAEEALPVFERFYATEFTKIGQDVVPNPAARQAVETLRAKGYPVVLATMPLFPRMAVEERLRWAGLSADYFMHLTTYENSTSVKPKLDYYREVLATTGFAAEDVLMVGNNTQEDLVAMELGCDAFLVTDWLLDPLGYDQSQVKHGSMAEFAEWVNQLPPCC